MGPAYKAGSFPSGHASTAFAIGGLLALGLRARWLVVLIVVVATLVALSRAVVGVHWPLDILGGVFGGWLCAVAGLWLGGKNTRFRTPPADQLAVAAFLASGALGLVVGDYKKGYPLSYLF